MVDSNKKDEVDVVNKFISYYDGRTKKNYESLINRYFQNNGLDADKHITELKKLYKSDREEARDIIEKLRQIYFCHTDINEELNNIAMSMHRVKKMIGGIVNFENKE